MEKRKKGTGLSYIFVFLKSPHSVLAVICWIENIGFDQKLVSFAWLQTSQQGPDFHYITTAQFKLHLISGYQILLPVSSDNPRK